MKVRFEQGVPELVSLLLDKDINHTEKLLKKNNNNKDQNNAKNKKQFGDRKLT